MPASIVYLAAILSSWLLQLGAGIWCLTSHGLRLIGACLVAPLPMVVALDLPGKAPIIVVSALVIWVCAARTRSSPLDAPSSTVSTLFRPDLVALYTKQGAEYPRPRSGLAAAVAIAPWRRRVHPSRITTPPEAPHRKCGCRASSRRSANRRQTPLPTPRRVRRQPS